MASNCRSRKRAKPFAIATDRTAMPYRRIVGMGVGDEGSQFAMLVSFVSQPTYKELCAKVGGGLRGTPVYRGGVRSLYFSTEGVIRPDRH
jgi:hypothetical protein